MAAPSPLLLLGALLASSAAQPPAATARVVPSPMVVTVGVLLPEDLRFPWAWPRVAPALSLAREALQPQLSLSGLAVRTAFVAAEQDSWCVEMMSLLEVAKRQCCQDFAVLLGPSCLWYRSQLDEFFGQYWRLPLLRAGPYHGVRDRFIHTEVYAGPLRVDDFSAFQAQVLRHFNWTSRAVLLIPKLKYRDYFSFSMDLREHLRTESPDFVSRSLEYQHPRQAVRFIRDSGRVAYIFGFLKTLHEIMRLAEVQNMTNGDYVFFYLDIWGESLRAAEHREAHKPWQSKERQDTGGLREAFQSHIWDGTGTSPDVCLHGRRLDEQRLQTVLVITPHEPQIPEYWNFEKQMILRAQKDFGVAINDSMGHLVAGCFHDGLLMYLKALNETLREGGTKQNTSHILEKMRGLKFQGVTGTVSINDNYIRQTDFDLWAMNDVESGEFQVVGHYIAMVNWINWTGTILWKKGRPPFDNPPCVFDMDDPSCGAMLHDHDSPLPIQPGVQKK